MSIISKLYLTAMSLCFLSLNINAEPEPDCSEAVSEVAPRRVAYYAHPLSTYNTPQETRDLQIIASLGFDILNPNAPEHDTAYKAGGMDYFATLIRDKADLVIFRALPDGSIPAGIAKEIATIKEKGGLVIELPTAITRRTLSVEETREYLKENGTR